MKSILSIIVVVLAVSLVGCGGDPPKGANKDKDKPVPADKKDEK